MGGRASRRTDGRTDGQAGWCHHSLLRNDLPALVLDFGNFADAEGGEGRRSLEK